LFCSLFALYLEEEWSGSPDLVLQRIKEDFGEKAGFLSLSPGEVQADGLLLAALLLVIRLELFAEASRLDAHNWLDPGIVARRPAEDLDSDDALFHVADFSFERSFHDKAKELPHAFGVHESGTLQNPRELGKDEIPMRGQGES